jgi:hypothetical protein
MYFMLEELVFSLLFLVLAWYFDHTIASNRGVALPSYFLCTKKYWACGKNKHNSVEVSNP